MAKPSKRVAARQAELSKRKKQHRPLGEGAGPAVAEPLTDELVTETPAPVKSAQTITAATTTGGRATPTSGPQTPFRQPSFRGANRAPIGAARSYAPASSAIKRPMPRSPYQGQDLKAIGIVTVLLVVGLVALRVFL